MLPPTSAVDPGGPVGMPITSVTPPCVIVIEFGTGAGGVGVSGVVGAGGVITGGAGGCNKLLFNR